MTYLLGYLMLGFVTIAICQKELQFIHSDEFKKVKNSFDLSNYCDRNNIDINKVFTAAVLELLFLPCSLVAQYFKWI